MRHHRSQRELTNKGAPKRTSQEIGGARALCVCVCVRCVCVCVCAGGVCGGGGGAVGKLRAEGL